MYIILNYINHLYEFANKCSHYAADIKASQNGCTINAKSILGLLSLDLTKMIDVEIETNDSDEQRKFYDEISAYAVNLESEE